MYGVSVCVCAPTAKPSENVNAKICVRYKINYIRMHACNMENDDYNNTQRRHAANGNTRRTICRERMGEGTDERIYIISHNKLFIISVRPFWWKEKWKVLLLSLLLHFSKNRLWGNSVYNSSPWVSSVHQNVIWWCSFVKRQFVQINAQRINKYSISYCCFGASHVAPQKQFNIMYQTTGPCAQVAICRTKHFTHLRNN